MAQQPSDPGPVAEKVLASLVAAGYPRAEPSILQPSSVFLDQSGEDIRGRLFLVSEASGAELCLRPEYTIPVCREYLASSQAGEEAAFSYCGPVFRQRPGQPGEFVQAGLESFGRSDAEAADAEIFGLTLEALAAAGLTAPQVKIGDAGLVGAFLDALKLAPAQWRRLRRGLMRGKAPAEIFAAGAPAPGLDHSGVLAALEGVDAKGARALVQDLLSIAGVQSVGGRSTAEIAERFLEQAALRREPPAPKETLELLDRFLAVKGDPDVASAELRALAAEAGLDLGAALDSFDLRTGFLAAGGAQVAALDFATAFHRNLDYYDGFVFEARDASRPDDKPVAGGGRYDRLLKTLGAAEDVPAVGAAIWIERLGQGARA